MRNLHKQINDAHGHTYRVLRHSIQRLIDNKDLYEIMRLDRNLLDDDDYTVVDVSCNLSTVRVGLTLYHVRTGVNQAVIARLRSRYVRLFIHNKAII